MMQHGHLVSVDVCADLRSLPHRGEDGVHISAVNMFSISTDVTSAEVYNSIQMFLSNCSSSLAHCRMVLHHQLTYHGK